MRIVRAAETGDFVVLPNATVRDRRLSYRARGLLAELLSHQDGWETSAEALAAQNPEGRQAIQTAMRELREAGYMVLCRVRDSRGRLSQSIAVYSHPQDPQVTPPAENLSPECANSQVTPEAGFRVPVTDASDVDPSPPVPSPSAETPQTRRSHRNPENRPPVNRTPVTGAYKKTKKKTNQKTENSSGDAGVRRAADLNETARRADTERLVTEWRKGHGDEPYAAKTYLALAQALDALEDRDGLSDATLREMLRLWDERGGRSPKLIPHLRDEAARNVRAATAPPPVPPIRDQGPRPAPSRPRTGRGAKVQGWLDLAANLAAQDAAQSPSPNLTVIEGEIA